MVSQRIITDNLILSVGGVEMVEYLVMIQLRETALTLADSLVQFMLQLQTSPEGRARRNYQEDCEDGHRVP